MVSPCSHLPLRADLPTILRWFRRKDIANIRQFSYMQKICTKKSEKIVKHYVSETKWIKHFSVSLHRDTKKYRIYGEGKYHTP